MKRGIFSEPDYVRLWIAGTISSAIRWLDALAFSVVAYQQSGSAFLVAMLMMLRLLPMGLFGAFFGALAERVQRRSILLAITAAMGVTSLALTLLAWSGHLAIWHLAVAAFINGVGWLSDSTVRRLLMGEVVGAERVSAAVSFDSASSNLSRMLGPTAGGLLLAGIGVTGAFGLGAVLYIAGFLAIAGMRYRNIIPPAGGPAILARIMGGITLVRRDRRLVGVLTLTTIFNLFGWPATSMVPVLAQGRLALGTEATGLLVSMDGLGALIASLLIGTLAALFRRYAAVFPCRIRPRGRVRAVVRRGFGGADRGGGGELRHHADHADLSRRAGRNAQPGVRRAERLHRHRPAGIPPSRAARRGDRGAPGHRDQRGGGVDRPGAHLAAMECAVAAPLTCSRRLPPGCEKC